MRRAVQTMMIGLENYPHKERNQMKIKLHPWFRESIKSQCDIALLTKDNIQYPELDLSLLKDNFWFLESIISSGGNEVDHREKILERIAGIQDDLDKVHAIVDYLKEISPERIEDPYQCIERVSNAKKILGEQLRQIEQETGQDIKPNSILVVAHSNFLRNFTGTGLVQKEGAKSEDDITILNAIRF